MRFEFFCLDSSPSADLLPLCLQAISQYLPRGDLRLRPAIYEMILHDFLKTDYEVGCPLSFHVATLLDFR